jgi:transmembrane sensor
MKDKHVQADPGTVQAAAEWWTRLRDPRRDDEAAARWLEWTSADGARVDAFERIDELASQLGAIDPSARAAFVREFAPRPAWRRRWLPLAAAATFAAAALATGWFAVLRPRTLEQVPTESISTAIAVERDVALADGSRVALGGASELHTRFARDLRQVELARGEAYFEVAHDAARPFVVAAGAVSIRAVGTAFNVRRTGERVTIAVTEGRVRITGSERDSIVRASGADALEAVAGQQVSYDPRASGLAVVGISPAQATSWRDHRLEFVNEPLDVVVANINRYSTRPLRIADAQVETLTFTGTVRPDALDGWLRALGRILPVRVAIGADAVTLASIDRKPR